MVVGLRPETPKTDRLEAGPPGGFQDALDREQVKDEGDGDCGLVIVDWEHGFGIADWEHGFGIADWGTEPRRGARQ
ncbi:MAG: hypothetical protein AMXMBFR83_19250 [Phycisphaerae bacterium]